MPNPTTPSIHNPELTTLHADLLKTLATALHSAAIRLQIAAAGQSTFTSDADLKATLALLKLAPQLLPLIAPPAPPPKPPPPPAKVVCPGPPLVPKCPVCGKGPGAHHPEYCPENPDRIMPGKPTFSIPKTIHSPPDPTPTPGRSDSSRR